MLSSDLKPCPFCGAGGVRSFVSEDRTRCSVRCIYCGAGFLEIRVLPSDIEHVREVMHKRWNRRASDD